MTRYSRWTTILLSGCVLLSACNEENHDTTKTQPSTQKIQSQTPTQSQNQAMQAQTATEPASAELAKPLSRDIGKKRYEETCKTCHEQGLLDAPKTRDTAQWQARLAKGRDVLYVHSAKGFNKMPAQAVNGVSDAEIYAAVDYLLEQAQAK